MSGIGKLNPKKIEVLDLIESKKSKFPTTTSISVPISALYLFLRSVLGLAFKALVNSREVQDKAHQCLS
ncbi:hypothetical protein K1719_043871 [Acacia pycnantha]|nr:hypothetical protein K1719_043871 [Acacia pycnantha]